MSEIDLNEQEAGVLGFWHRERLADHRRRDRCGAHRLALRFKGTTAQQTQHADAVKRSLSLFAMPLAWAMRREMTAGDLDEVHQ